MSLTAIHYRNDYLCILVKAYFTSLKLLLKYGVEILNLMFFPPAFVIVLFLLLKNIFSVCLFLRESEGEGEG